MNQMKKLMVAASISMLASTFAQAQTEQEQSGLYVGAGLTQVKFGDDTPEPDNYLLNIGYNFNSNWAAEFQYTDSYSDADFSYVDEEIAVSGDMSLSTTAIYGVYRSSGPLYFKAKAGFMDAEAKFNASFTEGENTISGSNSESESGWAAGVGAGYRFGAANIELDYIVTDSKIDIDFAAISFNYAF
jgi:outer membrane immunogenic protein